MKSFPRWLIVASALAMMALIGGGYWLYTYQKQDLRRNSEANLQAIAQLKVDQIAEWRAEQFRSSPTLALVIGLLAFLVTAVGMAWQKNRKANYKELFLAERALRRAGEGHRITLMSVGDGIISTDIEGRVELVNPVAEALTGWRQEEARGKPLEEVFRILNEETRRTVENSVSKVLSEGLVARLANHTVLVAKDGTERPIADSGAPIRDEYGEITGAVLVFRDQSKERAAQKALIKQYQELKETHRRAAFLADLIEKSSQPLGVAYPDGRIGKVNEAFCRLTGYNRDEIATIDWATVLTPPEWQEKERNRLEELDRTGKPVRYEKEYIRKNGTRVPVELLVHLVKDKRGEPEYYYAFLNDITERRRAEEALSASEERYRALFHHAPVGIFQTDSQGRSRFVNPHMAKLVGAESCEEAVDHFRKLSRQLYADPRRRDEFIRILKEAGEVTDFEYEAVRMDGAHRWFSVNARISEHCSDGSFLIEGFTFDVTERKKAVASLGEREAYLKAILNNVPFLMWLKDREGRFLAVNDVFAKSCKQGSPEAVIGKTDLDLWPVEAAESYRAEDREVMTQKLPKQVEEHVSDRGDTQWLEVFKTPILDEEGNVLGTTGFARDITDQKELARQLLQAQKMEAVGTLAGGVAHDFNNILQVALGYSELILGDEGLPENHRADLKKVNASARQGAALVQRLLTFSRRTEIQPQPLNLNRRIIELREMLDRTIQKTIDIQLVLSENLATINADPTQIDQILMNLAVNARDAMPDGGGLIFETANIELDEEYARWHPDARLGHHVLLTVTDTGSGMDKETLEHIFEPFYTTKAAGEGTGLGLAMVHGIVKRHHGFIDCQSEVGRGTAFKIYLPAAVSQTPLDPPVGVALPQGGTETILLVDDEEVIRILAERILARVGYTVLTASNGREALEIYLKEQSRIAAVILDLIMPEMDGRGCLKELLEINPSVKILIASGFSVYGPSSEAVRARSKGFINKPYDMAQMLQMVRDALDKE